MKKIRWIIPAAAFAVAACSEASTDMTSPNVSAEHALITCSSDVFDCGPDYGFTSLGMVSDTSPPAPTRTTIIALGSTNYVGFLMSVRGIRVDQMGKTTFWSTVEQLSDTSPPAPAPPSPSKSIVGQMGKANFLTLLNKAMSASSTVGPAPSDTSPPGPAPVAAVWRDAQGQPTAVLLVASVADMQKFGLISAGDNVIHMRMEMQGRASLPTQFSAIGGVSIISPDKTLKTASSGK